MSLKTASLFSKIFFLIICLLPHSAAGTNNSLPHNNCYWVEPNRLLAGEYPGDTTKTKTIEKLNLYLDKGVTSFIDLTQEGERPSYEKTLHKLAKKRNMTVFYKRFPIKDMGIPSSDTMHRIITTIQEELEAGRTVYFHCWKGRGRTGTVTGCYLTTVGLTGAQALNQLAAWWKNVGISRTRISSPHTQEQRDFVLQYCYK